MKIQKVALFFKKGKIFMTDLVYNIKKIMEDNSSLFSLSPKTDYNKYVPENAEELMRENWQRTGNALKKAMDKVGDKIG